MKETPNIPLSFPHIPEKVYENIKQVFPAGRSHQHRNLRLCLFIDVKVVAITLPRHDLQVVGRPNRIGQREAAIPLDAQMGFQLFLAQPLKAAVVYGSLSAFVKDASEKFLQEAHRKSSCNTGAANCSAGGFSWVNEQS